MFKITRVNILPSKAGNGLKIRDFEIGCAKIVEVEEVKEEGSEKEPMTFDELLESTGFSVGYTVSMDAEEGPKVLFDSDFEDAKNYVLVMITKDGVSIITSTKEICDIFGLSDDDVEMLTKYIGALANDRQLSMQYLESEQGPIMFFRNKVDVDITRNYLDGELDDAVQGALSIMRTSDFMTEYVSDSFIKLFLIALIKACQDRYNKVNRDDMLRQIAAYLEGITYWDDGQLYHSSILDIENYINDIKGVIRIG